MQFSYYQLPACLSPKIAHLGEKLCHILFSEPKSMIWCVHVQFRFTYHCRRSRWRRYVRPPCRAVFRSRRCRYARSLGRAVSGSGIVILFVFSILIARGFFRCYFLCPHSRVHCCLLPGRSCFRFEFGFQASRWRASFKEPSATLQQSSEGGAGKTVARIPAPAAQRRCTPTKGKDPL